MPKLHSERRQKYEPSSKAKPTKEGLSKYIKKQSASQKQRGKKREKNTYQFVGFYERLKSIDVKASHASLIEQEHKMDRAFDADSDDNFQESNFIQLMAQEKVNNASPEYKRVWKALDTLAYSFPLVILNRSKIVQKLLSQLAQESFKPVYPRIIDLLIALIKDLRGDIYPDFVTKILPACVAALDIDDLVLMDAVFSLFSFAFKYLLNPLRQDLANFYPLYVELPSHKNRYIRKFAAQAFSYVLRKVSFTEEATLQLLTAHAITQDNLFGLTDLVFEACCGQQQELHSKSEEIINAFLQHEWTQTAQGCLFIRYLYIKLHNTIDTQRQIPIYQLLLKAPSKALAISVITDTVKLKFGRRVSPDLAKLLLTYVRDQLRNTSEEAAEMYTEALSLLYYFHHSQATQMEKLFTHLLFQQPPAAVHKFYALLRLKADQITTETDLPLSKLLDLQQSSTVVQFSAEGHQQKHRWLLGALHKWALRNLSVESIELLLSAVKQSNTPIQLEIGGSASTAFEELIKLSKSESDRYIVARFVDLLKDKQAWVSKLPQNRESKGIFQSSDAGKVIDLVNQGYTCQIPMFTEALLSFKVSLNRQNAQSYFILKQALARGVEITDRDGVEAQLGQNLAKNSRELRLLSLQLLVQEFGKHQFLAPGEECKLTKDQVSQFYTGECPLYDQLWQCEKFDLSMQTEKQKTNLMRRVLGLIETKLCPKVLITAAYHYAVGCFWVKFSPLFEPAHALLDSLLPQAPELMQSHLDLTRALGQLLYLSDDNSTLLGKLVNVEEVSTNSLYLSDAVPPTDFVQVRDFYLQVVKCSQADLCFSRPQLANQMLQSFDDLITKEYISQSSNKTRPEDESIKNIVLQANQVDTEEHKQARKVCAFKLKAHLDLLASSSSLNRVGEEWSRKILAHSMLLVGDERFQQSALSCLLKMTKSQQEARGGFADNWTIKLPKYQKLLEGLADDTRFRDMILVITFGSQTTQIQEDMEDGDVVMEEEQKKKTKKEVGSIPKLADEDRPELLPLIVKLLLSKLANRKLKQTQDRRTLIYQFLASLNPASEYPIFFAEVLAPLNLPQQTPTEEQVRKCLQKVSFGTFVTFVGTLEVIFTQLGTLLIKAGQGYLKLFTQILVLMLAQAKQFMGSLAESSEEQENLYQFVQKQCKVCVRSCLKILKQIYQRFGTQRSFIETDLSPLLFREVLQSELPQLSTKYVHQSSKLVELLTNTWSLYSVHDFRTYERVLPSLMAMLRSKAKPEVCQQIISMLKNLLLQSISTKDQRLTMIQKSKELLAVEQQEDSSMDGEYSDSGSEQSDLEQESSEEQVQRSTVSEVVKELLSEHIVCISQGLYNFWHNHGSKLKHALVGSQGRNIQAKQQIKESIQLTTAVRDLTFIMSELSAYIGENLSFGEKECFLEMMIGLVSQKNLLQVSSAQQKTNKLEDLLIFGLTSITKLIQKGSAHFGKVCEFFLHMQSKPARQLLAQGLHQVEQSDSTAVLVKLNTIRKGFADVDYDFELILEGVQAVSQMKEINPALLYCTLALTRHQEYSVRESALHAFAQLNLDQRSFLKAETFLIQSLKLLKDEMLLRSALQAIRTLTSQSSREGSQFTHLKPLLAQDQQEDFFTQILSLTLPSRVKALRKCCQLSATMDNGVFGRVILPLVDFLTTDMLHQQENRRSNTVRYTKDQANLLQEEALNVYTSYATHLKASQYFQLVRKLLYKIEKYQKQASSVAALKTDSLQERMYCKCLCKVLDGFNFPEVPDAVQVLMKRSEEQVAVKKEDIVEYSSFLKDMVGNTLQESDCESNYSDGSSDSDDGAAPTSNQIQVDLDQVHGIQAKLRQKVLPLLQRHLTQKKKDSTTIRSFVALTIAKVIRRLPVDQFKLHLHKLINLIVVKGLRERDLNTRDKARNALLQVVDEVSPRFITTIVSEMQSNLDRGFQLHVYLYTVHVVLQHIKESQSLQTGQITSQLIRLLSPLLLREMFGDLMEERKAADSAQNQKKHIKESKARKAMPVYEVLAQFCDFKHSFLELIQPIVKVLEENPTHQAMSMTEELLQRVAQSVLKNLSISAKELLPFLKQIIEKGIQMAMRTKINDEKAKRDYGQRADSSYVQKSEAQLKLETHKVEAVWLKTGQQASDKKTQEICGRVLANFGLQTLKKSISTKDLILDNTSEKPMLKKDMLVLLDPFVQPLLDSFKTYHNPIVVQVLLILSQVVHLSLPSFPPLLKKFLNRIFALFQTNSSADNEFTNSLFKCTAELIKTPVVYQDLSNEQIGTLVKIVQMNLQNYSTQASVFTCLRQVLHKRFESAELYDLMQSVQDMMVTSVQQTTRQTCASLFVQFVIDYPLGSERLETHFKHLLKNLSYSSQDGRQQLLEVLLLIVDKTPQAKLQQWQDLIFVTLFLRVVNESYHKCREVVSKILKTLVMKSNKKYTEALWQMQTPQGSDSLKAKQMLNAKMQVLALIAECGKLGKRDGQRTVELVQEVLNQAAEKVVRSAKARKELREEESDSEDIMDENHAKFLRGIGLESSDESEEEHSQEEAVPDTQETAYFAIKCLHDALSGPDQLSVPTQLQQDLVLMVWKSANYWVRLAALRVVQLLLGKKGLAGLSLLGQDDKLKFGYKMVNALGFPHVTEELCSVLAANLQITAKELQADERGKLFKKASFVGRRILGDKSDQTKLKHCVLLKLYKAYSEEAPREELTAVVPMMLELVYRTYTDETLSAEVRDLSQELVDSWANLMDKESFVKLFNQAQQSVTQARTQRKMALKMKVTSEEGLGDLARRRKNKLEKKRLKHKQTVLKSQLTR